MHKQIVLDTDSTVWFVFPARGLDGFLSAKAVPLSSVPKPLLEQNKKHLKGKFSTSRLPDFDFLRKGFLLTDNITVTDDRGQVLQALRFANPCYEEVVGEGGVFGFSPDSYRAFEHLYEFT